MIDGVAVLKYVAVGEVELDGDVLNHFAALGDGELVVLLTSCISWNGRSLAWWGSHRTFFSKSQRGRSWDWCNSP